MRGDFCCARTGNFGGGAKVRLFAAARVCDTRMRFNPMVLESLAQLMSALGDAAQLGDNPGRSFSFTGILGYPQMALHAKPFHGHRLVFGREALAFLAGTGRIDRHFSLEPPSC